MKDYFLKIKHWKLFLWMFAVPILTILAIVFIFFFLRSSFFLLFVFAILLITNLFVFFAWHWSIGTGLSPNLPEEQPFNLFLFKLMLSFPFIYMILIILFVIFGFYFIPVTFVGFGESFEILFIILHLFLVFSILYIFYQNAKIIKAIELNRKVRFQDFMSEFLLLWFHIIGVWVLQPRINKIYAESNDNELMDHLVN